MIGDAALCSCADRGRGANVLSNHRAALLDRVHGARGQLCF